MSYQVLVSQVRQALREEDTLKHPEPTVGPTGAPASVHTNGSNNNNNDNTTTALLKKKKKPKRRTPDNPPPPPPPVTQRGDASAPTPTPTPAAAPAPSPAAVASPPPPPPPPSLLRRFDRNEQAGRAAIVRMLQAVVPPLALRHVWELEGLRRRELLAEETHAFTRRVLVARGNRRRLTGEGKPVALAPSASEEATTAPVPRQQSPAGGGSALHATKTQSSVPDSFWYDLQAAAMAPAGVAGGGGTTLRDAASSPMPAPAPSQPQKQKKPQQQPPPPQPQKQQKQQKQPPQPQPGSQPQQHQQQKQKRSGAKHPRPPGPPAPSASSPPAQASAASAPAPHAPATPHQPHSSASTAPHASRSGGSTAASGTGDTPLVRLSSKEAVTDRAARRPLAHHKRIVRESSRALPEPPAEGPQRPPASGRGHPAEPPPEPQPQPQPLEPLSSDADTGVASLIAGSLPGVPLHTQSVSTHVRREGSVVSIVSTTTNTEYALYQPATALSDGQHNHSHGHGHHHHHHGHRRSSEAELSGVEGLSAQEATARRRLLRQQSAVRQAVERVMVCTTEVVARSRVNASRLKGWSKIRRAFEAVPAQPAAPLPASDPPKQPFPQCAVGTRVRVKGLRGKPEFNGRVGLVVRHVDGQVCVRFPDTGAQEFVLRPRFYEAVVEGAEPAPTPSVPIGERRRAASQIPVAAGAKPPDTVRSQSANLAGSVLPSIAPAAVRRQQ